MRDPQLEPTEIYWLFWNTETTTRESMLLGANGTQSMHDLTPAPVTSFVWLTLCPVPSQLTMLQPLYLLTVSRTFQETLQALSYFDALALLLRKPGKLLLISSHGWFFPLLMGQLKWGLLTAVWGPPSQHCLHCVWHLHFVIILFILTCFWSGPSSRM